MLLPTGVRDLIVPLCIPTPFAVGDVFSYLIKDKKIVLVDCGHYSEEAQRHLKTQLREQGLLIQDIDEIWLTHGHPDHFGQAARIAELSGAAIYGHPEEQANFGGNDNRQLFRAFFEKHKIPEVYTEQMMDQLAWLQQFLEPVRPRPIEEGDELTSGDLTVVVKHTPGHAPGHVVFDTRQGLIFGGDLLLEHISTNALVNFNPATGQRNKSLLQYRKSLHWTSEQQGIVLPGHGDAIKDIPGVASHHLREHEERYHRILGLIHKRSMNLMDIARHLFADAIEEGAIFLVLSEVIGYLDWGLQEGDIIQVTTPEGIIFKKP